MIGSTAAVSGVAAAAKRIDVAAANIAHVRDTGPPAEPKVKPVAGIAEARERDDKLYRPAEVLQTTVEGGGTRAEVREREPAAEPAFAPDDPNAGDDGTVARPSIDIASEFVDITLAQRAYEAAIKALRVRDQVLGTTIDARS
jgi:flagellar basal-body rod protein FlgC